MQRHPLPVSQLEYRSSSSFCSSQRLPAYFLPCCCSWRWDHSPVGRATCTSPRFLSHSVGIISQCHPPARSGASKTSPGAAKDAHSCPLDQRYAQSEPQFLLLGTPCHHRGSPALFSTLSFNSNDPRLFRRRFCRRLCFFPGPHYLPRTGAQRCKQRRQSTHALPDRAILQKRTPASQTTHLLTPRRTGGVVNRPARELEHWPAHRCCCLYRHRSPTGNHPLYRLASSWQYLGTKPGPGGGRHRAGAAAGGSSHHAKKDSFAQSHPCTLRALILNRLEAPTHACHSSAPVP